MSLTPIGSLPLRIIPYNSRINSLYDRESKNYVLVAFNPGYALQASELNEMQELFFINQSLNTRMMANWTGNEYNIPFWEGLIPLAPSNSESEDNNVIIRNSSITTGGEAQFQVEINPGWFYWTDYTSKLSFWIRYNLTTIQTFSTSLGGNGGTEFIGFDINTKYILCCPSINCGENDNTLRDNSTTGGENFFTCGASRVKAEFVNLDIRDSISNTFYPIFSVTVDPNASTIEFKYPNGFII